MLAGNDPDAGWSLPAWTYADPEFDSTAASLERLLDAQADTPAVRTAYRRAMQLELGFFEASLTPRR